MADTPRRIQMSRQHPWRAEHPDAVIVARPTRWGNPFDARTYGLELSLRLFRNSALGIWDPSLLDQSESNAYWDATYEAHTDWMRRVGFHPTESIRYDLHGRDLACWCKPTDPCHADVLLSIANGGQEETL